MNWTELFIYFVVPAVVAAYMFLKKSFLTSKMTAFRILKRLMNFG